MPFALECNTVFKQVLLYFVTNLFIMTTVYETASKLAFLENSGFQSRCTFKNRGGPDSYISLLGWHTSVGAEPIQRSCRLAGIHAELADFPINDSITHIGEGVPTRHICRWES